MQNNIGNHMARMFCEKLKQGCWLSLLSKKFEEVSNRLLFDCWDVDDNSIFNNSTIRFKTHKVNVDVAVVGFYVNEFDAERYFEVSLDNPVELEADFTYLMFSPGALKVRFD